MLEYIIYLLAGIGFAHVLLAVGKFSYRISQVMDELIARSKERKSLDRKTDFTCEECHTKNMMVVNKTGELICKMCRK